MTGPSNLLELVAAAWSDAGIAAERAVVVGCSGGPDSVVLADVLMELSGQGRVGPITLVYVDHGLRAEIEPEVACVKALAARGGAECVVVTVSVPEQASLEDAARQVRHRALHDIAETRDAVIALAHTASDQAETVLMRIVRGTGIHGLAAMAPRRGRIVRPLLGVWRDEIITHAEARQLTTITDPMNADQRFFRVRARQRLLPGLREENPALDAALVRLANTARDHREMVDAMAERLLEPSGTMMQIDVTALCEAPIPVAKRAIAMAAEGAGSRGLESNHLDALMELARREEAGSVSFSAPGLQISRIYGVLRFGKPADAGISELHVRGIDEPYEVRPWRPGDRMRPERLKGRSRKLSDLYTDAKVPREQRERARVVIRSADAVILWAEYIGRAWDSGIEVVLTPSTPVASNNN